MLIGLHDAEREHIKDKTFPNYALMKISAHHKARGDCVEWWEWRRKPPATDEQITITGETAKEEYCRELSAYNARFDLVYSSKVFDFTPENPHLPQWTIKGGTGYGIMAELPPEMDAMQCDYSVYPHCDYAIGYITRGCPNSCPWCVVPEKEGNIKPYRSWREIVRPDSNKLVLMDNNILACEHGIHELESLIGSGYAIDLNQGMDARLFDERIADICARLKWIRYIRFSCDDLSQFAHIRNAARLLEQHGIKNYKLFVYLLVTKDITNAAARVAMLKTLKNVTIYAQHERNGARGIVPNRAQLEFAGRYIYGRTFRKETWAEYCEKRNLVF